MKYIVDQPSRFETVPANTPLLVTSEGIIIPQYSKTKFSYQIGYSTDGFIYSMNYPLGRFIRRASRTEIPVKEDAVFTSFSKSWNIEKAHDWVYLWSSFTIDESQFKPGLSCNGGSYRFGTERKFFARIQGDDIKFCYLDVKTTSSEFGYCQLTGEFCNETTPIWFQNVQMGEILISTNEARNLGLELGDRKWDNLILDRVATLCEFNEVWNTVSFYIDEDGVTACPTNMYEKKNRIRFLKTRGVMSNGEYKTEIVKYHRANRASREERLSLRKSAEELARILDNL